MLQSLHISNYALIDRIDIDFGPGLNIITGETGAGKSIMLSALGLLLGGRADLKAIRDRNHKSVIEASFTVDGYSALKQLCADNDIEWDDQICLLRRELSPSGRTRAFINDSPITLSQLRAVTMMLVDLHSQHQNLLLATPEYQLNIIDSLASNQQRLDNYEKLYSDYKNAVARYRRQRRLIEQSLEDEEFTRFQLSQLEDMHLIAGEQEELETERELLTNIGHVKSSLAAIMEALNGEENDAISLIRTATDHALTLTSTIAETAPLADRLESLRIELQDIADSFSDYDSNISADPGKLNA
ncbi:MAG: AAA family ATPase, partial [Muribaculaceae bacterium]|nr:AAA family ATPase [Muribaculaceae bacterium]